MSIRRKRRLCANISIAGFTLAYFSCLGLEQGFLTFGVSVSLMVIGILACVLFGYKGGFLK